jgi:hypothetical protein
MLFSIRTMGECSELPRSERWSMPPGFAWEAGNDRNGQQTTDLRRRLVLRADEKGDSTR